MAFNGIHEGSELNGRKDVRAEAAAVPENDEELIRSENDGANRTQAGIQRIEGITTIWPRRALIIAYGMIWLIYFVEGILAPMQGLLNPYVTSTFAAQSLTPTVGILSSIIGGCANFTIAKVLDVFGRPNGFLACVVIGTVGLVMMAACQNVESYAAAEVFYVVGNNGLQYALSVLVADTSSLQNRGLMSAFSTSANLITCWLAGPIATRFLAGPGWSWAFGVFSILVPLVCLPLYILLEHYSRKARKLVTKNTQPQSNLGSYWKTFLSCLCEFDAVGLILLSGGAALFLLPFDIYTFQAEGWRSPLIICLLVFGLVLLVLFAIWERFLAPVTFIPYDLLFNRTVLGASLLSAVLFFSAACWNTFYSSFLQVVADLSVTDTNNVLQVQTVINVIFSFVGGAVIHATGNFKAVTLYFAIPITVLGTGLMIFFRHPNVPKGYLIMCQTFLACGEGIIEVIDEIAALSAASHQHIAVVIATISFAGSIGSAIGLTITGTVWQAQFPKKLAEYLPSTELGNLTTIYASLDTQLSYPVGSPTRVAIQKAYGSAQADLLILSTAVWGLGFLAVVMMRNVDVRAIKQVRGQVV